MKIFLIVLLLITWEIGNGQNLVPNPSFEDTVNCPTAFGQILRATDWFSSRNTPDYFNACSSTMSVPNNPVGHQAAADGNAYCGIQFYDQWFSNWESVGALLNLPLSFGVKYFISFKVSLADNFNCGVNRMGVRFSTFQYSTSNPTPIDNFSHLNSTAIITDTASWATITGSFVADSAYQYVLIGNFYDQANTDTTIITNESNCFGYYYLDEICVSTDSLLCNPINLSTNEIKNNEEIILYPNPFKDKLTIQTYNNEHLEVILYDISYKKILQQTFTNSITINTELLEKGMYLYEVRDKTGLRNNGKVIKQ